MTEKEEAVAFMRSSPESWLELPTGTYTPTWVEIVVLIGVIGLGALAYMVLTLLIRPKEATTSV